MTQYRCTQRLTTDGGKTIHEVGELVELSDADAQSAIRQGAVELAPGAQSSATPVPAPVATAQPPENLEQMRKQAADLEQQIATMEHEGGAQS